MGVLFEIGFVMSDGLADIATQQGGIGRLQFDFRLSLVDLGIPAIKEAAQGSG